MKKTTLALILFLTAHDLWAQMPPVVKTPAPTKRPPVMRFHNATNTPANSATSGSSSPGASASALPGTLAAPGSAASPNLTSPIAGANAAPAGAPPAEEMIPAGNINFQGVDVSQVLAVYAQLVGRTLLRAGLPTASIILKTETPLTKSEAIQALQAVLALNGIAVVNVGDKFVKVVPSAEAIATGQAFNDASAANLPDLGSFVTHIVQLKYVKPSEMVPALIPFAKLNSIIPLESNGIIIIRDYAENVKRMLEMIAKVDVNVPEEYISEVIPIKYALASDMQAALNSLGGGGGGSVSIGNSSPRSTTGGNGFGGGAGGGLGGAGGYQNGNGLNNGNQQRGGFGATANGTPSTGSTFQQKLQSIISKAAGGQQDQIQVFGQAKIVADERSNSLLVFASREDMVAIKNVISKLDVLLSQVLIESVIMEVSLDKTLNTGVSAVQNPRAISSPNFKGTGGYLSGPSFFSFMTNGTGALTSAGTNLSGGLSYFGQIGNSDYDIAIQAAASDNTISIIQKPRIQTFQAQKASFFVGQTVPYVTGSSFGSPYGNSSSYAQLSVGVQLDVTPFINPDGLVVMEIDEEIDDISGSTFIQGVGNVPNTNKRTLSSQVAVKDRDTIILGGAIYSLKSLNKSGVPVLQDIPLLGALFSSRASSKNRQELLVLMRPTVLKTPELASIQAKKEEARLPGIAHAEAQDTKEELKQVQAEEKLLQIEEQKEAQKAAKAAARAKRRGVIPATGETNAPPVGLEDLVPADATNNVPPSSVNSLY